MAHPLTVPDSLKHLTVQKGYPVPYFVAYPTKDEQGQPAADFRYADPLKLVNSIRGDKCFVCGKPLAKDRYLIAGPEGLKNRIHTDMPMHEACARFSLTTCPHLVYERADRRTSNEVATQQIEGQALQKPGEFYLVRLFNYGFILDGGAVYINFQPSAVERWHYVDGRLVADGQGWQRRPDFLQWMRPAMVPRNHLIAKLKRLYL
ncbi:hypothetical protein FAES_3918 [Fibrella aestuarina BUZ 2]|uniref:Uncharacterized protein n=1 Tax=Fibrella aestuarina BUZ 2 TaxID=1166018 RepID=I0KCS1_9BACT|nr:hypothetical protein [Fibrella aestuarina]CCH01924.1 hypothetical protein FAES_3918 [Fibrella aestuarina BUZ 2]